ncbi:MAG: SiaB family protein kinase [Bacteroidetes bacterium]|nr:SiaB family protein kinase [Bacteroidota bacterium]
MSNTINSAYRFFEQEYEKHLHKIGENGALILAYDGVLNNETISKLESQIEEKIIEKGFTKTVTKKLFFICVESLQNMLIHGQKDESGSQHNFFIISNDSAHVKLIASNLVLNANINKLTNDMTKINGFTDPAALKTFYLEHLENNEMSEKGGAGLGFITIAMKSGNKLNYNFSTINDKHSMFLLESSINLE